MLSLSAFQPFSPSAFQPRVTALTSAPPVKSSRWFEIKALAESAELRLRGYVGEASSYTDYYGEEHDNGGMGTLKEFEEELTALGAVPLITVYLTSQGGDFPTALAIHSILTRHAARIVCVIDGYAYSAAPIIAAAADEVRAARNALIMIHDTEIWCAGSDVASLQESIKTLQACNDAMAASLVAKAGGTPAEWMARMEATTWLTGEQAHGLGLVDTLLDPVALSAFQPLRKVTAKYSPPPEILALIDTAPVTPPASISMKPTPELILAAAAFGITLTAASSEADCATALTKITAAAPAPVPTAQPAEAGITAADVTTQITAALAPLQTKLTAAETELARIKGLQDHGLGGAPGSPTAAAGAPVPAGGKKDSDATPEKRIRALSGNRRIEAALHFKKTGELPSWVPELEAPVAA